MAQFEPLQAEIKKIGSLVFIAAEKRGGFFRPEKFLSEHPISFRFLLDEDRAVTKSYGVYHRLGVDAVNIARPATFIIGHAGTVRWIYVGKDQHDRAPVQHVLAAFRQALAPDLKI
jgi:peroxiredoxin